MEFDYENVYLSSATIKNDKMFIRVLNYNSVAIGLRFEDKDFDTDLMGYSIPEINISY